MSAKAVVHDDYVTKADLDVFGHDLHGKIVHDIASVLDAFMERVDERFDRLEARVDKLEENFERLNNTLDAFLKRLDDIETDNHARDAQIARMERWIEQIAKKTGVQLEY